MRFTAGTSETTSPTVSLARSRVWVSKAVVAASVFAGTVVGLAATSWAGPISGC